ncbi:RNA methyltransferase [Candidatus Uhrbacteria bacterium]|nr:RNA methyltransferase [Candidatus Uhrbacteria bacterium]
MIGLILDNIRSLHNVGAILRTADGFGVERVWLCGITGTPHQAAVKKTALGAESSVPWERVDDRVRLIKDLKKKGIAVIGLECGAGGVPLPEYRPPGKIALVVGNEVEGISAEIRPLLDALVEIPMRGTKESFNVAVATGIALYRLRWP